ncbi:zona pellucida sperm-binding protein 4-like [Cololabis saira]|uniref:zona pellucida sperm-binding protein 4-like n=1 Tax=Cololabis saira TaxID=129043 RepID=UPI002AD2C01B|nr:zona pellucida sperm-binding protein 4-like [Cololabis saira]
MELLKWLFGVFVCHVSAQNFWSQKYQPSLEQFSHQETVPAAAATFDECAVEEAEKIQCGVPDITAEECEDINCCFNGRQCYYRNAVTVQCTRDGQFIIIVARDSTMPPIDVHSISLLAADDDSCGPVDESSAFAIFQFPVTACGTTLKDDDDYVVYENHMSSSYEVGLGPRGSITRDSHFELLFQCRYSGSAVEALVLEVNPLPSPLAVAAAGPLRVELRLGSGQCYAKGCVPDEAAYDSFYTQSDYPIVKVLREPIYVDVHLLGRSDPNIVLNLEHCWATSTPNPQGLPQWDLLVDGCPYHDDRYLTTVVAMDASSGVEYPTHYKRFISKMFTFVTPESLTPQKETVFIHCSTAVCHPSSSNSCEQRCHRQRRAAVAIVPSSQKVLVSSGEVILTEQRKSTKE